MWSYQYSDELYHHGIKGMKWGVRRYQKKDGSLTSAGKKRYKFGSDIKDGQYESDRRMNERLRDKSLPKGRDSKATKVLKRIKDANDVMMEPKSEYAKERDRQKKHIVTKRAVDIGSRIVNEYTKRHDVTLNGHHVGISNSVKAIVNKLLDYKYMKDTFK